MTQLKKQLVDEMRVFCDEETVIRDALASVNLSFSQEESIVNKSKELIRLIQNDIRFSAEELLQMYDLSTGEGMAIMCLAEGLLRIPDRDTAFALLVDKLGNKDWPIKLAQDHSDLSKFISIGLATSGHLANLHALNNNPFIKISQKVTKVPFLLLTQHMIKWLGNKFILGHDITHAIHNIKKNKDDGVFSFDLLGESSRNFTQSETYYQRYLDAIDHLGKSDIKDRHISLKLTALYPRFELTKLDDIDSYLLPKLVRLINKMDSHNIAITFDAEESYRLEAYLHVVSALIKNSECKNSNIGVVVQAYQKGARDVIDAIIDLARLTNKKIPIRLVKGAYWDSEIKYAQTNGLHDYPVFTRKECTDINYLSCAKHILDNDQYIYPQFATHNAITAATIIELGRGKAFEFQKLQGMGNALHRILKNERRIRTYAPVGQIQDLLAYLMRRLLENGANTSFIHQAKHYNLDDLKINPQDLFEVAMSKQPIASPQAIYSARNNSIGYDMGYKLMHNEIKQAIQEFNTKIYEVGPIIDGKELLSTKHTTEHFRPSNTAEKIGAISVATESDIVKAIASAADAFNQWTSLKPSDRAEILRKIADLYNENRHELYSLLLRESGKSINDAIAEVREAIDFCRYYALSAEKLMREKSLPGPTGEKNLLTMHGRGVFLCISPWNFPLAIFTGQVVAALVSGNCVIAKPAEHTPIIANIATKLMHLAGVPGNVLHLLITSGSQIGKYVTPLPEIAGVAFTGSNATAKLINSTLAARDGAIVPIIAETGGQNAMIVDSSALLEQVTDDVMESAFYSTGQRCSCLRTLYIQEEIYTPLLEMIAGAVDTLKIGDTIDFSNDIGPVIDKSSHDTLTSHIKEMKERGFNLIQTNPQKGSTSDGFFFYPQILEISSINDIPDERFGPILHVIKYKASDLDKIIDEINNCGFGLTFGVHSRIEARIEYIRSRMKVGNIYANRSMTGAQVESQPFGGENKSGTGFKAGGPHYLLRFMVERTTSINLTAIGGNVELLK